MTLNSNTSLCFLLHVFSSSTCSNCSRILHTIAYISVLYTILYCITVYNLYKNNNNDSIKYRTLQEYKIWWVAKYIIVTTTEYHVCVRHQVKHFTFNLIPTKTLSGRLQWASLYKAGNPGNFFQVTQLTSSRAPTESRFTYLEVFPLTH